MSPTVMKELDRAQEKFDTYQQEIKELNIDTLAKAPLQEVEPQTKIAQVDKDKMKQIYLKPNRIVGCAEKFNEKYRDEYNFKKEYVYFTAENAEVIGEEIVMWCKCFPGMNAEEWKVPVNKPLWAPRYVAEQIKGCKYHRFVTQDTNITSSDGLGTYHGSMVVKKTVQRLNATPESQRKSIFMGAGSF